MRKSVGYENECPVIYSPDLQGSEERNQRKSEEESKDSQMGCLVLRHKISIL